MSPRSNLEARPSQTARIVALLRERRGQWVPLCDILDLRPRISQFSARVWEARHRWGLPIENRTETINGEKHSWFRLIEKSQPGAKLIREASCSPVVPPASLFGDLAPESYGVD